jgi:hypothetical protein
MGVVNNATAAEADEMGEQQTIQLTMRASDGDRQQVVERLQGALEEGRLSIDEFSERTGLAFHAVTYGDLAPLCADLPASSPVIAADPVLAGGPVPAASLIPATGAAAAPAGASRAGYLAGLPTVLKVLWTIWLVAVSVNVVVWALVTDPAGRLSDPWPLWVAGPYGAVLFALSAAATLFRRRRPPAARVR